jgi:4-amino-4-deoxy-L-arabinose transferase-like glycosyltransferase
MSDKKLLLPVIISSIIIACFAIYYWNILPYGNISRWDEYFTLERSSNFLNKNDWLTVYTNQIPNFNKPPLQYWITAILIKNCDNLIFALRYWSYFFGLALLASVGLLAYAINPKKPYVIPTAILIMSGSSLLWRYSISAMLDTGAAFFTTLTIASFIIALRNPKWWYVTSVAIGFGTLQKSPLTLAVALLLFSLLIATNKIYSISIKNIFSNVHFKYSTILMILLTTPWPLIQIIRYGKKYTKQAFIYQVYNRFIPTSDISDIQTQWWQWIIRDDFLLWIPSIIAALFLIFYKKIEYAIPLFTFIAFSAIMTMASGEIHQRYILQILPILVAGFTVLLSEFMSNKASLLGGAIVLTFFAGQPFQTAASLELDNNPQAQYLPYLREFAQSLKDDETPIRCFWGKNRGKIFPGAFHYYASNGRKFHEIYDPLELQEVARPPYRGICPANQFQELNATWGGLQVVSEFHGMVHWVSDKEIKQIASTESPPTAMEQ